MTGGYPPMVVAPLFVDHGPLVEWTVIRWAAVTVFATHWALLAQLPIDAIAADGVGADNADRR